MRRRIAGTRGQTSRAASQTGIRRNGLPAANLLSRSLRALLPEREAVQLRHGEALFQTDGRLLLNRLHRQLHGGHPAIHS